MADDVALTTKTANIMKTTTTITINLVAPLQLQTVMR